MEMTSETTPAETPTVDIAQLTEMLGLPADQQGAVAAWTGDSDIWISGTDGLEPNPRWTADEAAALISIWHRETAEDGD